MLRPKVWYKTEGKAPNCVRKRGMLPTLWYETGKGAPKICAKKVVCDPSLPLNRRIYSEMNVPAKILADLRQAYSVV